MTDHREPTDEGLRRYPATAGFYPDLSSSELQPDRLLPCTCAAACETRCAGECGCKACDFAFVEFCDVAGMAPDVSEAEALERYRAG